MPKQARGEMSRRSARIRRKILMPFEWVGIVVALVIILPLNRRVLFGFCDLLSRGMYRFDRRGKRRALENLRIVCGTCMGSEGTPDFDPDRAQYNPTRDEERIIRRSYRNMARTVGYAFWTMVRAKTRCEASGGMDDRVRAFLAANRPAVTVSAHLGCWEILSQLAFLEGHRMMSVAKDIGTSGMTRLLMRARRSIGQEIVSAKGAFRALLRGVRDGKSLGLLVDQRVSVRKGGVRIRFFDRPMSVSAAPAFFASKAGLPIIVAWSRPLKDGRYRCEFVSSYAPDKTEDVNGLTQRIADDLARVIRRHPSCWVLNYNYFASRSPIVCDGSVPLGNVSAGETDR